MAIALLHFVSFYTFSVKLPDIQVIVNQTDKLLVQQSDSATLIYLNTGDLNVKYRPRLMTWTPPPPQGVIMHPVN
jgi:hypothetical protein